MITGMRGDRGLRCKLQDQPLGSDLRRVTMAKLFPKSASD